MAGLNAEKITIIILIAITSIVATLIIHYHDVSIQCEDYSRYNRYNDTYLYGEKYEECMHINGYFFTDVTPLNNPEPEPLFRANIPNEAKWSP